MEKPGHVKIMKLSNYKLRETLGTGKLIVI